MRKREEAFEEEGKRAAEDVLSSPLKPIQFSKTVLEKNKIFSSPDEIQ